MSFSQRGPRSVCILAASGTISNVAFNKPGCSGSSDSTFTYEVCNKNGTKNLLFASYHFFPSRTRTLWLPAYVLRERESNQTFYKNCYCESLLNVSFVVSSLDSANLSLFSLQYLLVVHNANWLMAM